MSNNQVPARLAGQVPVLDESKMSYQELKQELRRRKENKRHTATLTHVSDVQKRRLAEILNALPRSSEMTEEDRQLLIDDTLDMIDDLHPQDHFERMLINQLAASHQMAMYCFKRATNPDMPGPRVDQYLKNAEKMMTAYTKLLTTLNKHRGKNQQKVTVEYVHVADGGKAIVGAIDNAGGGTTIRRQSSQSHESGSVGYYGDIDDPSNLEPWEREVWEHDRRFKK
jgi:hypothetical protein